MPHGKPAGVRCIQLTEDNRCRLFGHPSRPSVCTHLIPSHEMCKSNSEEAMWGLLALEKMTRPLHGGRCADETNRPDATGCVSPGVEERDQ